jgi:nucleotide-binding universal stress UspA family protein
MPHIQKILVPIDGSPSSIACLWEAVMLAEELGAAIDVLHVDAPDQFAIGSSTSSTKTAKEKAEREMDVAVETAESQLGGRLRKKTASGDPVRRILEVATGEKTDLIVIGTHGRIGRQHALVGSVAEAVVRSAPCPVLTVRRAAGEGPSASDRVRAKPTMGDGVRPSR